MQDGGLQSHPKSKAEVAGGPAAKADAAANRIEAREKTLASLNTALRAAQKSEFSKFEEAIVKKAGRRCLYDFHGVACQEKAAGTCRFEHEG